MRIATLIGEIREAYEIGDVSAACSQVLADEAFLEMKALSSPGAWEESYREIFGVTPTLRLFQQHACDAVEYVTELGVAGRLVGSGEMNKKIGQLFSAVNEYRNSIPGYFAGG